MIHKTYLFFFLKVLKDTDHLYSAALTSLK